MERLIKTFSSEWVIGLRDWPTPARPSADGRSAARRVHQVRVLPILTIRSLPRSAEPKAIRAITPTLGRKVMLPQIQRQLTLFRAYILQQPIHGGSDHSKMVI
jgi:hypothetical protein